ncbi:AsmA family protein [Oceanidesulfovibrio marinus]|uniref:AsmA family protein n=1 Tax=Oceanidesulfovibrio marinus TaxID=370038 RepID=A0ABX6NFT6_9BACT|nr:AsmA family protein [Oceanidesulfovibrio marinus]QJT09086.1 AsmA family protein [Oceanidesulfovibrio marinus]
MIRRILLGLCLSFALLVTLAALVLVLQDGNEYRDKVEGWLSTQVGSDVRIQGDLNLSIYPWLGLRVEAVKVANPQGFGAGSFIRARSAVVRMRLGPLLRRREIVLDRLVLDHPVIELRRKADGRSNWLPLMKRLGMAVEESPPSLVQGEPGRPHRAMPERGWTLRAERMRGISIMGGTVGYLDEATGETLLLDRFSLETGPGIEFDYKVRFRVEESTSGLSGEIALKGECALDPAKPSLKTTGATFTFDGSVPIGEERLAGKVSGVFNFDTAAGLVSLENGVVDTGLAHVEFSVHAPLPVGMLPVSGQVNIAVRDTGILSRLWRDMITDGELQYVQGLKLRAQYRFDEKRVQLEELQVELADMAAHGRGELLLGDVPSASLLLSTGTLALEDLFGGESGMPEWLQALLDKGTAPAIAPLGAVRLNIGADKVSGYGLDLNDVSMDVDMDGKDVRLEADAKNVFGGSVHAKWDVRPGEAALEGSVESLSLAQLGGNLRENKLLTGAEPFPTGTLSCGVHAKGASVRDLLESGGVELSGRIVNGGMAVANGAWQSAWSALELTLSRGRSNGKAGAFSLLATANGVKAWPIGEVDDAGNGPSPYRVQTMRLDVDGVLQKEKGGRLGLGDTKYELTAKGEKGEWSLPGTKRLLQGLGTLNLKSYGQIRLDTAARRLTVSAMTTEGFGLLLKSRGTLDYGEAWKLQASLNLPEFAPRVCMTYLGVEPPANLEPGVLSACLVQAKVEAKPGWLRFKDLNLRLDESVANGEFTLSESGEVGSKWALSFDLSLDAVDADSYLFGHPHPQQKAAPSKPTQWDLDWLKKLRSRGRLRIRELELFDLYYQDVDLILETHNASFSLEPFTASFYNGKLRLGIHGEVADTLAMVVDLELEKFDLFQVLMKLGDVDQMGGETSIVMHMTSTGLSSAQHLRTLSGGGDVMVRNGFYAYFRETTPDTSNAAQRSPLKSLSEKKSEPVKPKRERVVIPVSSAHATIQIQDGIFRNSDFIAKGDSMTAKGSGTMNIPLALLDYTIMVDAKVIPEFPIIIQGPLDDPAVEQGGVGFVETIFTTFRNILTLPFSAMDAISKQARQLKQGLRTPKTEQAPAGSTPADQ